MFPDAAQLRKQVQGVRKNKGGGRKRTANEAELDEEPANQGARQELVRLEDIEMVYSKRRKDKEAKMEAILKGKICLKHFANIYSNTLVHSSPHLPLR